MNKLLLFCLLLSLNFPAKAQEPAKSSLNPCGTRGISEILRNYQWQTPSAARSDDTLWVAVQVHLLAKDNGSSRLSNEVLLNSFCQLNEDFAASNIQFYFKNDWNEIRNSGWHTHESIPEGIDMMLTNNVPDALNAYFAAYVAGNCGYNLPYAGVAVSHSCSGAGDHTWTHEVGHALSLPHPFIGWEGKLYSASNPTPTLLTYDYTYFHDTLDTQIPAPLDTALVELLDGSNCAVAADLICDTKPDYLSYRWDCDSEKKSLVLQKDPNGAEFYSDGTLYMSYANDICQNRFSPEEINIMRNTLLTEKANWLAPTAPETGPVSAAAQPIQPVNETIVPLNGTTLTWNSVPNATHYLVQASRFQSYALYLVNFITSDTFVFSGQLSPNLKYYWRVRPFNERDACMPFSASATFRAGTQVNIEDLSAHEGRIYPNPMDAAGALTLECPHDWLEQAVELRITDAAGKRIWQTRLEKVERSQILQLPAQAWPPGIYCCYAQGATGSLNIRLVK